MASTQNDVQQQQQQQQAAEANGTAPEAATLEKVEKVEEGKTRAGEETAEEQKEEAESAGGWWQAAAGVVGSLRSSLRDSARQLQERSAPVLSQVKAKVDGALEWMEDVLLEDEEQRFQDSFLFEPAERLYYAFHTELVVSEKPAGCRGFVSKHFLSFADNVEHSDAMRVIIPLHEIVRIVPNVCIIRACYEEEELGAGEPIDAILLQTDDLRVHQLSHVEDFDNTLRLLQHAQKAARRRAELQQPYTVPVSLTLNPELKGQLRASSAAVDAADAEQQGKGEETRVSSTQEFQDDVKHMELDPSIVPPSDHIDSRLRLAEEHQQQSRESGVTNFVIEDDGKDDNDNTTNEQNADVNTSFADITL